MDWITVALTVAVLVSNVRWFVTYRQMEKTLQRALEKGESWEQLYHDVSGMAKRVWLKHQDMAIENTRLHAELKQVKEKYLHAVADAVVFED